VQILTKVVSHLEKGILLNQLSFSDEETKIIKSFHFLSQKPMMIVANNEDFVAMLEADAPMNAGELVTFSSLGFDIQLPEVATSTVPEVNVTIDNVSREIMPHLKAAATSNEKIEVTYRPYLASDPNTVQMDPPLTLTLKQVSATPVSITGVASMLDIGNKAFPSEVYTAKRFPGLAQ